MFLSLSSRFPNSPPLSNIPPSDEPESEIMPEPELSLNSLEVSLSSSCFSSASRASNSRNRSTVFPIFPASLISGKSANSAFSPSRLKCSIFFLIVSNCLPKLSRCDNNRRLSFFDKDFLPFGVFAFFSLTEPSSDASSSILLQTFERSFSTAFLS